jgi:hypothetical protein
VAAMKEIVIASLATDPKTGATIPAAGEAAYSAAVNGICHTLRHALGDLSTSPGAGGAALPGSGPKEAPPRSWPSLGEASRREAGVPGGGVGFAVH